MAKKSIIARETKRKYKIRVRNRCRLCGRPRGYMRRFWIVSHLLPGRSLKREHSGRSKGKLVEVSASCQ